MFNEQRPVQILELFGGIGSPRCALRNLGIPTKAIDYVEIDEKAVRSYNSMFAEELPYKTQSVVGWNLKPDILIHGSPCQDMSIAGHQGKAKAEDGRINRGKGADQGSGTRSSLMWETIHIIEQMGKWKPKYVIWENVRNVTSRHMIANFIRYQKEMERIERRKKQLDELDDFAMQLNRAKKHETVRMWIFGCRSCGSITMVNRQPFDDWHECPVCRQMVHLNSLPSKEFEIVDTGETWQEQIKRAAEEGNSWQ